jgi:hypothetical protein
VNRWIGEVPEFKAKSIVNKANRGHAGTHGQGNRSHDWFKSHMVHIYTEQLPFIYGLVPILCVTTFIWRCRSTVLGSCLLALLRGDVAKEGEAHLPR